jgi:hypothetical protein
MGLSVEIELDAGLAAGDDQRAGKPDEGEVVTAGRPGHAHAHDVAAVRAGRDRQVEHERVVVALRLHHERVVDAVIEHLRHPRIRARDDAARDGNA